jgi:hypothetical protein
MIFVCGIEDHGFHHHQQTQAMTLNINKFWMWFVFLVLKAMDFTTNKLNP